MEAALQSKLVRQIMARKAAEHLLETKSRELYYLNQELKEQRDRLDMINTEVKDSIEYSKRIQQSLLPINGIEASCVEDHFVLYLPKDIVSGDFYWQYEDKVNKKLVVATADCTGHGVPGAFMSIIGKQALDLAVIEHSIYNPSEILHAINAHLSNFLQKEHNTHIQDGMDISVYCINYSDDKHTILSYAGAMNSIYVVRNSNLVELKANRTSIGYLKAEINPFKTQYVNISSGDMIYSYSDGYADQFGGPIGKKLKSTQFKKILQENSKQSMKNQRNTLETLITKWKGELEQVDDICVLGIRIK